MWLFFAKKYYFDSFFSLKKIIPQFFAWFKRDKQTKVKHTSVTVPLNGWKSVNYCYYYYYYYYI